MTGAARGSASWRGGALGWFLTIVLPNGDAAYGYGPTKATAWADLRANLWCCLYERTMP